MAKMQEEALEQSAQVNKVAMKLLKHKDKENKWLNVALAVSVSCNIVLVLLLLSYV